MRIDSMIRKLSAILLPSISSTAGVRLAISAAVTYLLLAISVPAAYAQAAEQRQAEAGQAADVENDAEAADGDAESTLAEQRNTARQRPIEEITVRTEQSVMALRFQLRQAEDDMFSRFNELNNNDEFDVNCRSVKHASSHIPRRECEPRFFTRERQSNSIQVISQMRDGGTPTGGGLGGGAVAGGGDAGVATSMNLNAIDDYQQQDSELKAVLGHKYEEMNEEMFRIASENPDFLNALLRVEAYRQALVDARSD